MPDVVKKVCEKRDDGKDWPQVLAILVGCIVGISNGILYSWTSPSIPKITKDKINYDITEDEAFYLTVIPSLSLIASSILCSNLNDFVGRKLPIIFIGIPNLVSLILCAVAQDIWTFYAARVCAGIADGFFFSALPAYIGEITTPAVRSKWANAMTFSYYCGECLIQIIGSYFSVKMTSYICIPIPLLFIILFSFMPESPYYWTMKGKHENAKAALRWFHRKENVDEIFAQLKKDVERQMSESGTWNDLFVIQSNRKALLSGVFLRLSQMYSGIVVFAVYTQFIFEKSGGNLSPQLSSIIFTSFIFVFSGIGGLILHRLGRRKSYIISTFSCGIVLLIGAIYFYIDELYDLDITFLNWVPLTILTLYVIFFSIGLAIVPTIMLGELFSASIKSKGISLLIIVMAISAGSTSYIFYPLTKYFGLYSPFLLFSASCFISTILSLYLVPETKGKTLEEIQQYLKGNDTNSKK